MEGASAGGSPLGSAGNTHQTPPPAKWNFAPNRVPKWSLGTSANFPNGLNLAPFTPDPYSMSPIPCEPRPHLPWPSDGRADVLSLPYTAPVARNRQFCRRSGSQSGRSSAMNICPIVTARDKPRPNCGLRLFFRDGHTCLGSWTGEIWKSVTGREVHPERWQIDLPLGFQGRF